MKQSFKVFHTAFWISSKHSSRGLLCLLCVFLVTVGILGAYFAIPKEEAPVEKARIGVLNLDTNPLSLSMMESLLEEEQLSGLIELSILSPGAYAPTDYTAILTLPEGFLESVLNGTNLSPLVEINEQSPLEAMWVRQLATAGAAALSEAQYGIYAVLEEGRVDPRLDDQGYQLLIGDINLRLLRAFFDRINQLDTEFLSPGGVLTLQEHYFVALGGTLLFCYGFFFFPAVEALRRFSRAAGHQVPLFLAGLCHVFCLVAVISLPVFLLASGTKEGLHVGRTIGLWLLFAFLETGAVLVCCLALPSKGACEAGCILLTLAQALCGGLLLPLQLLPTAFTRIAAFLPLRRGMELLGSSMKPEMLSGWMGSGFMAVVLLGIAVGLWLIRGGRPGERGFLRKGGRSR